MWKLQILAILCGSIIVILNTILPHSFNRLRPQVSHCSCIQVAKKATYSLYRQTPESIGLTLECVSYFTYLNFMHSFPYCCEVAVQRATAQEIISEPVILLKEVYWIKLCVSFISTNFVFDIFLASYARYVFRNLRKSSCDVSVVRF